jgi:hypothetical protein
MKSTIIALACGAMLGAEARRGGGGGGRFGQGQQQGGSMTQGGDRFGGQQQGNQHGGRGQGGKGAGKDKALEVLAACESVIDFDCDLDTSAADLLATITEHKLAVEEWKANGKEGDKPARPSDDVKVTLEGVRQCMRAVKDSLPEDSDCLAVLSNGKGHGGGKGHGKGLHKVVEAIGTCGAEIESSCALNFDIYALADAMASLKEAAEAAKENGDRPERIPKEVKESIKAVGACIREIKDDNECLSAVLARPEGDDDDEVLENKL